MHRDAPHKDSLSRLEQVTVSCNLIEKEKVKQNKKQKEKQILEMRTVKGMSETYQVYHHLHYRDPRKKREGKICEKCIQLNSVQSPSHVQLFATP